MKPRNVKFIPTSTSTSDGRSAFDNSRAANGEPPHKKFRSSAAPKGTKLASGYTDRAAQRGGDDGDEDEQQKDLKELEELLKREEIDRETFERRREELGIGGDVGSTHLVKGLDFKLLERVRRGENVSGSKEGESEDPAKSDEEEIGGEEADVDDELEKALAKDVEVSSGDRADADNEQNSDKIDAETGPATLSRDEILRQMKERRKNPGLEQSKPLLQQPSLDQSRFKKLDPTPKLNKKKFTESINGRRREVLVITNKDGTTKRKTRWLDPEPNAKYQKDELSGAAWGSDRPEEVLSRQKAAAEEATRQTQVEEDDDDDIFGGVADYDPLAGLDSDAEEDSIAPVRHIDTTDNASDERNTSVARAQPLKSTAEQKARNYFDNDDENAETPAYDPRQDPSILAALKHAAQLRQQEESKENDATTDTSANPEDEARNRALLKKLQQQSRGDDVDIDMSFGGDSRYDEEDDEAHMSKQKLSHWKGLGQEQDDEDEDGGKGEKKKRTGGGKSKKRKGDKNSFADVMSVIQGRKQ